MSKEELASLFVLKINELIEADRFAFDKILSYRTVCNKNLLGFKIPLKKLNKKYKVGTISLLNYIIGPIEDGPFKGCGYISVVIDDVGNIIGVERTDLKPAPMIHHAKKSVSKIQSISSRLVNNFFKRLK